jgi:peptidyl-prolyl cis-trans isomerase SurA
MKKLALAFVLCAGIGAGYAQPVFTYGKHAVSKDEFVRAFNKNPNTTGDKKKALREYLDLYVNFKLKVQAAYDSGLDKDQTQVYELQNFRRQIAENIINEQANVKELVKEAFTRSQKDIHLAHVFIEIPKGDTAAAYKRIQEAYKALQQGKDFAKVAAEYSTDIATQQAGGDLGFITVFTLPYEFENIAYSVAPNTYSAPVRTSIGYHIFKNKGERKPLGTRRVAQILIAVPPNASEAERAAGAKKADSVYQVISGKTKTFEEMVAAVSNDMSSNGNNGQLPEFGIGSYNPVFEKAAFDLNVVGDISKPFSTSYGYHILKLLEVKPVSTDAKDDLYLASLQEKVTKDGRLTEAKKGLIKKHLASLAYKPAVYNQQDLFTFTDSNYQKQTSKPYKAINDKTVLYSFSTQKITAGDWLKFVRAVKSTPNEFSGKDYKELLQEYVRVTADENYRNHLDKFSPEFEKQVQEFKEANLLFAVMDKNVWGKANEDNDALQAFYNGHRSKYTWQPSADALIITCANEATAEEMQNKLRGNLANWRSIADGYGSQVAADSGRYELSQLPVVERTRFSNALMTAPVKNVTDGTVTFNYIVRLYEQQMPRVFDDARGMVISDYQQVLEEKWLAELKKKYPVKVNEAVFNTLK